MDNNIIIVSRFSDTNINHFLQLEINAIWRTRQRFPNSSAGVLLLSHDPDRIDSQWRVEFLKRLFSQSSVFIKSLPPESLKNTTFIELPPFSWAAPASSIHYSGPMVNPFDFNYGYMKDDSDIYIDMISKVKHGIRDSSSTESNRRILFIKRTGSRLLFDAASGRPLEDVFMDHFGEKNIVVTTFEGMSLEQQIEIISTANTIVGAHGAALTNIVFAEPGSRVFEVSFRRHWCCDPICESHMNGSIEYDQECPRKTQLPYHKADYRNLAIAFKLDYNEVQNSGCHGFVNNNPINVLKMFVDANDLVHRIILAKSAL